MTTPQRRHISGAVAAAVARVLDINPALLRWDTPLADLGVDDVALVLIADVLIDDGLVTASDVAADLPKVSTFGEMVTVVSSAAQREPQAESTAADPSARPGPGAAGAGRTATSTGGSR